MQPTQLSLMPQQGPAPPVAVGRLPQPQVAAALTLLARLIAQAARTASATGGAGATGDE